MTNTMFTCLKLNLSLFIIGPLYRVMTGEKTIQIYLTMKFKFFSGGMVLCLRKLKRLLLQIT